MTSAETAWLIDMDQRGFLPGPGESVEQFRARTERTREENEKFAAALEADGRAEVFGEYTVTPRDRIAPELVDDAARITGELYGFAARHVPGFYLRRGMGPFWGGCMLGDPETGFAVFMLRDVFRRRRKFLSYRREELLAHELCHSARQSLDEPALEEYFAYRTSGPSLRRYLGNCFITDADAWGFVLPVVLLPVAELARAWWRPDFPTWIFWILAAVYPLWLLARNLWSRRLAAKARRSVAAAGATRPDAVLFRCTLQELEQLGAMKAGEVEEFVRKMRRESPRWAVIAARFFDDIGERSTP